jgi:hypothetical protein
MAYLTLQNWMTDTPPPLTSWDTIYEPKTLYRKLFGECSQYCLTKFQTRFGTIVWFVDDAEGPDGEVITIRQADTKEEALQGLDLGGKRIEDL